MNGWMLAFKLAVFVTGGTKGKRGEFSGCIFQSAPSSVKQFRMDVLIVKEGCIFNILIPLLSLMQFLEEFEQLNLQYTMLVVVRLAGLDLISILARDN